MVVKYRLKNYSNDLLIAAWPNDILVEEIDTEKILGFFMPPQPGEVYRKIYEPETIINLADFPQYKDIKFFWLWPLGLDSDWESYNFEVEEALVWKSIGKFKAEAAKDWRDHGFSVQLAQKWFKTTSRFHPLNGKMTPEIARKFTDLNLTTDEIIAWFQSGLKPKDIDLNAVEKLVDYGLNSNEIQEWIRYSVPLGDILTWINLDVIPKQATDWNKYKFLLSEAIAWHEIGITAGEAAMWKGLNMTIEIVKKWRELGFSAMFTQELKNSEMDMEQEVKLWLETRLDFKKIKRLLKSGYSAKEALGKIKND
ncbi:hypothetical protein [Crocosphaera sp.]|uniref:hypothetical protein n=1 Tax=Crocosphaera sp. TaxID=2729996 RepID=UPI00262A1668|nr:hypothetical protein [Crocosphaera sp.]MDJ0582053.1 hypothetical protein [Crocosphaera sp.]